MANLPVVIFRLRWALMKVAASGLEPALLITLAVLLLNIISALTVPPDKH